MDARVYTDPKEDGAPQVGDVVTVAHVYPPVITPGPHWPGQKALGATLVLWYIGSMPYPWVMGHPTEAVHAVRRPTEAELAAWALTQPG